MAYPTFDAVDDALAADLHAVASVCLLGSKAHRPLPFALAMVGLTSILAAQEPEDGPFHELNRMATEMMAAGLRLHGPTEYRGGLRRLAKRAGEHAGYEPEGSGPGGLAAAATLRALEDELGGEAEAYAAMIARERPKRPPLKLAYVVELPDGHFEAMARVMEGQGR